MLQRTNIYLDKKTVQYFKRRAEIENKTMAEVIRLVLEREEKRLYNSQSALDSMAQMVRDAERDKTTDIEGKTDVALNHDYYLYVEPYEKKRTR